MEGELAAVEIERGELASPVVGDECAGGIGIARDRSRVDEAFTDDRALAGLQIDGGDA